MVDVRDLDRQTRGSTYRDGDVVRWCSGATRLLSALTLAVERWAQLGKAVRRPRTDHGDLLGQVPEAVLVEFALAIILAMADTLSLAAVKDRFSEIVDRVNKQHDRVIVTRNGVPVVVVVSVEELESLEETLEILSDRDTVTALHESEQQIAEGLDEVITEGNARARWIR